MYFTKDLLSLTTENYRKGANQKITGKQKALFLASEGSFPLLYTVYKQE
jgi:hypothetical protein